MVNLGSGEFGLRAEFHPAPPGGLLSGFRALHDQAAFQFREQRHHMQHGFAERLRGVYLLGQALELYASIGEVVQGIHHIADTAPQPVELPHYERVAMFQLLQVTLQGRAILRSGKSSKPIAKIAVCGLGIAPSPANKRLRAAGKAL